MGDAHSNCYRRQSRRKFKSAADAETKNLNGEETNRKEHKKKIIMKQSPLPLNTIGRYGFLLSAWVLESDDLLM